MPKFLKEITFSGQSTPSIPDPGYGSLYIDGLTNLLYYIDDAGVTYNLTSGGTDTYATGFTYNNANTLTIQQNNAQPDLTASINVMTGLTVNGNLSATTIDTEYIDFLPLTARPAHSEARIYWYDDENTLELQTENNDFNIEVGHQTVVRVRNTTGGPLTKGRLVYINGGSGNNPTVTLASYENDLNSARTLGFLGTNINDNQFGYVITNGMLRNVNTSAYSTGTQLYLWSAGTYSNQIPEAPLHEVRVGIVIRQSATVGIIFVAIMNGYELGELHDVLISGLTNNDLLHYNSSLSAWTNTQNIQINSISATTYQNLPTDIRVTGGTYSDGSATFTNNTGGTFTVSGFQNWKWYAENTTAPIVPPQANGSGSIALGDNACARGDNMFVYGNCAGIGSVVTDNSNFLGHNAGTNSAYGFSSNFFGCKAGKDATLANNSNFLGENAGNLATNADNSNFLGTNSGYLATSACHSNFIGRNAGCNAKGANNSNFIGENAGREADFATYSNLFGYNAGATFGSNVIKENNIIIGTNISLPNGAINSLNIGATIFGTDLYGNTIGDPSITVQSSGRIGIGVLNPTTTLHISGATNPLRIEGLLTSANTEYLTISPTGVVTKTSGATGVDTFTTGFTYSSNTFSIFRNQGLPNLTATINSVTGLTSTGTISSSIISATTYQNLPYGLAGINNQTVTAYTFTLLDSGYLVTFSSSTSVLATIPTNISAPLAIGSQIMLSQLGSGQLRITGDTGVTLYSYGNAYNLVGQYSTAFLTKQGTNTWILDGNLTTLNL